MRQQSKCCECCDLAVGSVLCFVTSSRLSLARGVATFNSSAPLSRNNNTVSPYNTSIELAFTLWWFRRKQIGHLWKWERGWGIWTRLYLDLRPNRLQLLGRRILVVKRKTQQHLFYTRVYSLVICREISRLLSLESTSICYCRTLGNVHWIQPLMLH